MTQHVTEEHCECLKFKQRSFSSAEYEAGFREKARDAYEVTATTQSTASARRRLRDRRAAARRGQVSGAGLRATLACTAPGQSQPELTAGTAAKEDNRFLERVSAGLRKLARRISGVERKYDDTVKKFEKAEAKLQALHTATITQVEVLRDVNAQVRVLADVRAQRAEQEGGGGRAEPRRPRAQPLAQLPQRERQATSQAEVVVPHALDRVPRPWLNLGTHVTAWVEYMAIDGTTIRMRGRPFSMTTHDTGGAPACVT